MFLLAAFVLSVLPFIDGRPNGAPSGACSTITPGHGGSSQTIPGGFFIYSDLVDGGGSYTASQSYTIRLQGDEDFKGFLIQARTAGTTTPIGTFSSLPSGTKTLSCSGVSSASVTHTSNALKSSVTFTWTAPSTSGTVEFRYAVVKSFSTYYANINAADHRPPSSSTTASTVVSTSSIAPSSSVSTIASDTLTVTTSDTFTAPSATATFTASETVTATSETVIITSILVTTSDIITSSEISTASDIVTTSQTTLIDTISISSAASSTFMDTTSILTASTSISTASTAVSQSTSIVKPSATSTVSLSPSVSSTASSSVTTSSSSISTTQEPSPTGCPNTDKSASSSFPIVFRTPTDCVRDVNCTFYWAMGPNTANSDYLDVYMEGTAAGWMAVGFSENQVMAQTDVLGCRVNSGSSVTVIDGWNPTPNYTPNQLDNDSEDGIDLCVHTTGYTDGRISCLFSRYYDITDDGQDLDLDNSLWIIRAYRVNSQTSLSLSYHSSTPQFSTKKYNPFEDTNVELSSPTPSATSSETSSTKSSSETSSMTSSSTSKAPTSTPPPCPDSPSVTAEFPIVFRTPADCVREVNCTFYWAMGPNTDNSNYLDVYMQGTAEGWMAVGFSENRIMANTDVLGCHVDSDTSTVSVIDGWNGEPNRSPNQKDVSDEGLCVHTTGYTNGRITCLLSRYSEISDSGQDFDLNESYWIIRGYRLTSQSSTSLLYHTDTPQFSSEKYNPFTDMNNQITTSSTDCPIAPPTNARYPVNVGSPGDDYYLGSRVNDDNDNFMDFVLEGKTDGWVAVGFSTSKTMFNSDVFACKRESTGDTVNVIDTWNPSSGRTNEIDNTQSGICQHSSEYSDGRIKCTFSRYIDVMDTNQDHNLNTTLYQLYSAFGNTGGSGSASLSKHSRTPVPSDERYNLVFDALTGGRNITVTEWPGDELIKTHGILMITAWILLAGTGIFFASWMKPTLPNGEWFQVHRAFMIASLFTGVVGFVFAFVANAKNTEVAGIINFNPDGVNTTHFAFGWIIIVLQVANPIIAIFRCAPTGERRWIFNLLHGHVIGIAAETLAFVNIGIGISLIESGDYKALWLYIIFVVFVLIVQALLFIIYTVNAYTAPKADRRALVHSTLRSVVDSPTSQDPPPAYHELSVINDNTNKGSPDLNPNPQKKQRKKPLKSAPVRTSWIATGLYMVVVSITVLIMAVLIAIY